MSPHYNESLNYIVPSFINLNFKNCPCRALNNRCLKIVVKVLYLPNIFITFYHWSNECM